MAAFLNQFLFVNSAAYTLFGDKPISEMLIFIGNDADLMPLSEEELIDATPLDPSIAQNWQIWKQYANQIDSTKFILTERPCPIDCSHVIYSMLNKKEAKKILTKYFDVFKQRLKAPLNIEEAIEDYKNPSSSLWEKVFSDHYLSGLLFGYGEENTKYFIDYLRTNQGEIQFSDQYNPSATSNEFSIPLFALSPNDMAAKQYRMEREKIIKYYQNQDLIETTLERLR